MTVSVPDGSEAVVKTAWSVPLTTVSGTVARTVEPVLKITLPCGSPPLGLTAETTAVNVTGWPRTHGLAEEVSAAAVGAGSRTTCREVSDTAL